MNILHLEASTGWGGQEIRILREAEAMRELGHQVFLGVMEGGKLISFGCKAGFTVYPLNFHKSGWVSSFFQIRSLLKKHRIDLVNTHSSLDAWIGGIVCRASGCPVVRTRHLSTPIKAGWNSRILYGKLADFVVTTCASIIPMISKQSGKPLNRCSSIPTGVDPKKIVFDEEERWEIRRRMGISPSDFLVGTACFMRSWKGIADFLKAAELLKKNQDLKWVVIGGGHEAEYRRMAQEMGLEGIVYFTGHLDQPFAAMAALDVFALLSTAHEGVSQAILQAGYLGKPLIATGVGGLGEVCVHRKTGIQVDPFSASQVANAVKELKDGKELRTELGSNAKKWVEEHFTFSKTIEEMQRVYLETLRGFKSIIARKI